MRRKHHLYAFSCCLLLLPAIALAQDPGKAVQTPAEEAGADIDADEEIVVVGKKTAAQLRREIKAVETRIFALFNDLNDDDEYDIDCRKKRRVGSQMSRTDCQPRIYWDEVAELAQNARDAVVEGGSAQSNRGPKTALRKKHATALRQQMFEVAQENPALMQLLVEQRQLATEYAALKKK